MAVPNNGAQHTRNRSSTINSVRSVAEAVARTTRRAAEDAGQTALNVLNADPPLGAWAATAQASSTAPTLVDIRQGRFDTEGWNSSEQEAQASRHSIGQRKRGATSTTVLHETIEEHERQQDVGTEPFPALEQVETGIDLPTPASEPQLSTDTKLSTSEKRKRARNRARSSGYVPPPKLPWTSSAWIGFKAFLKWSIRPTGFLITLYCLNVVAWGGMLFLLLCNAGPAMCNAPDGRGGTFYDCDDLYSPRRVWIEIDSQILNALFCVTGFGLIPWRFRDLYYIMLYRLTPRRAGMEKKLYGLRKLGGINKSWFRLPGSDTIDEMSSTAYMHSLERGQQSDLEQGVTLLEDVRLPTPLAKSPPPPLTGIRAPPTSTWKLDFFIWCQIWNTLLQGCLCGFMWGYNRFDRPSWATGLFIALACIVAGIGGIVSYVEGRRVKRVEGVKPSAAEQRELIRLGLSRENTQLTHTISPPVVGRESVVIDGKDKSVASLK